RHHLRGSLASPRWRRRPQLHVRTIPDLCMPSFRITPADDLIDIKRSIELVGVPPGATVEIRSETHRADGGIWRADATFEAGADGCVRLERDPALTGSYSGISPMGLVWSQVQVIPP